MSNYETDDSCVLRGRIPVIRDIVHPYSQLSGRRVPQRLAAEMVLPPLFPVHRLSGLKRADWNFFFHIFKKYLVFTFSACTFSDLLGTHQRSKNAKLGGVLREIYMSAKFEKRVVF